MNTPVRNDMLRCVVQTDDALEESLPDDPTYGVQCKTSIMTLPSSPFLKRLGFGTGVEVLRIKRALPSDAMPRSPWAIKMLSKRNAPSVNLFRDRLTQESETLRKLTHPNIVGFRQSGQLAEGKDFLAMEAMDCALGNLLQERYEKEQGPLEPYKIRRMVGDALRALDYLHTQARLLHGDMKSYNVLVRGDFKVCKLCDFGVSLPLKEDGFLDLVKNPDAQYVGTGIWSAPEVLEGDQKKISTKADIFSFGLVVFETLALLPPHTFPGMMDESIASSAEYAKMKVIIRSKAEPELAESVILLDDEDASAVEVNSDAEERQHAAKRQHEDDATEDGDAPKEKRARSADKDVQVPGKGLPLDVMLKHRLQELAVEAAAAAAQVADVKPDGIVPAAAAADHDGNGKLADEETEVKKAPVEPPANASEAAAKEEPQIEPTKNDSEQTDPKAAEPVIAQDGTEQKVSAPQEQDVAEKKEETGDKPEKVSYDEMEDGSSTYPSAETPSLVEEIEPIETIELSSSLSDPKQQPLKPEETIVIEDDDEIPVTEDGGTISDEQEDLDDDDLDDDDLDDDDEFCEEEDELGDEISLGEAGLGYAMGDDYESFEEEDEGPYLNYRVLGTRPPIPDHIRLGEEYTDILELFHICTMSNHTERPSAKLLLDEWVLRCEPTIPTESLKAAAAALPEVPKLDEM